MTKQAPSDDRRPEHVAAVGFVLQLASFGTLLWASYRWDSDAIAAAARFLVVGLPIWVVLYWVFSQTRRVRAEKLETAELQRSRKAGSSTAIFEVDDEELLLEQNRLKWILRWVLPSSTVFVALILFAGNFLFWDWTLDLEGVFAVGGLNRTEAPTEVMWFAVGVGFFCFLCARYGLALARMASWRLLRAGAAFMAGNALVCLGLAIVLMAAKSIEWAEPLYCVVVRIVMLVLGLELALNFLLDLYRPRGAEGLRNASFDSRLLGLISEPGDIAKSIANAVNYQFGFEVSSTWFYKLLQRWMFPIMVATFAAVLSLTSVVVVDADEQAVIERFGRLVTDSSAPLGPGLHFKWPYPIDVVRRAPVARIEELVIGEASEDENEHGHGIVIWTEAHDYVAELLLLVASEKRDVVGMHGPMVEAPVASGESVPVSLLMVSVPIEYRIKDLHQYLYVYEDPVALMEGVAYQHLSDYAASIDIDELMGPGREVFNRELKSTIQNRLDKLGVGIEIVFAGLRGAHPPPKDNVAATFQKVVATETSMSATINAAEGEARRILTSVAGTEDRARTLDGAIQERDVLRGKATTDPNMLAKAEQQVEDMLAGNVGKGIAMPSGEIAVTIANARVEAGELISREAAKSRAFGAEVAAYEAAPELYKERKRLEMYDGLGLIRKYLIMGDPSKVIIEYASDQEAGLDEVLTKGLETEGK